MRIEIEPTDHNIPFETQLQHLASSGKLAGGGDIHGSLSTDQREYTLLFTSLVASKVRCVLLVLIDLYPVIYVMCNMVLWSNFYIVNVHY